MRKIIQIQTTCGGGEDQHMQPFFTTTALCDDGTLWERDNFTAGDWEKLPPIPQGE